MDFGTSALASKATPLAPGEMRDSGGSLSGKLGQDKSAAGDGMKAVKDKKAADPPTESGANGMVATIAAPVWGPVTPSPVVRLGGTAGARVLTDAHAGDGPHGSTVQAAPSTLSNAAGILSPGQGEEAALQFQDEVVQGSHSDAGAVGQKTAKPLLSDPRGSILSSKPAVAAASAAPSHLDLQAMNAVVAAKQGDGSQPSLSASTIAGKPVPSAQVAPVGRPGAVTSTSHPSGSRSTVRLGDAAIGGSSNSPQGILAGQGIGSTSAAGPLPAANQGDSAGARVDGVDTHGKDAFSAMDRGGGFSPEGWTHVGTHAAEAGYQDPTLGWVGVRAEVTSGVVHASLVPSSADAAQSLNGHLAGLNAYLADHHAAVGTVTLAQPESRWSGGGQTMGQGTGSGPGAGSGQTPGQGNPQGGSAYADGRAGQSWGVGDFSTGTAGQVRAAASAAVAPSRARGFSGGEYISVRA
ncbi:MAG TPA: hypothetical protein VMV57_04675 [Terracidiphilus sp.]|nr:hypothetical protein [Terracidiphilus sp.]